MIVELKPKESFQKDEEQSKAFRLIMDSPVFKEGVHKAIAQFVLFHKPTAEELEGVRRFLATLMNMAEKEEPLAQQPIMQSISVFKQPPPRK